MGDLRHYLMEHPSFIPLLGFPVVRSRSNLCGFDADASLPTQRYLTRMLREIPNLQDCRILPGPLAFICVHSR